MNWLDKWAMRRAERAMLNRREADYAIAKSPRAGNAIGTAPSMGGELNSHGMNLKIYKASGGMVIETNIYDRRTDRNTSGLYVVTSEENLGAEISKIITMESLKS